MSGCIALDEDFHVHSTFSDDATSTAGSPARRRPSFTGTGLPVTSSTVRITSRTL